MLRVEPPSTGAHLSHSQPSTRETPSGFLPERDLVFPTPGNKLMDADDEVAEEASLVGNPVASFLTESFLRALRAAIVRGQSVSEDAAEVTDVEAVRRGVASMNVSGGVSWKYCTEHDVVDRAVAEEEIVGW